jgi:hypothetical protein
MRLRLAAYLTGILFLCVLVFPLFSSYHNPRASHIDMAQGLYQISHDKKHKKYIQYLGVFSPPLRLVSRASTLTNPVYENSITTHAAAVSKSCRAPPE